MKKIFVILILICLFAMVLVSCNNNQDPLDNNQDVREHDLLIAEGKYAMVSSSLGIAIKITQNSILPKQYVVEWIIDDGNVLSWDENALKAKMIENYKNEYPLTLSYDANKGAVIWIPNDFENTKDITIKAYFYDSEKSSVPLAYSKIVFENYKGTYQMKAKTPIE